MYLENSFRFCSYEQCKTDISNDPTIGESRRGKFAGADAAKFEDYVARRRIDSEIGNEVLTPIDC